MVIPEDFDPKAPIKRFFCCKNCGSVVEKEDGRFICTNCGELTRKEVEFV